MQAPQCKSSNKVLCSLDESGQAMLGIGVVIDDSCARFSSSCGTGLFLELAARPGMVVRESNTSENKTRCRAAGVQVVCAAVIISEKTRKAVKRHVPVPSLVSSFLGCFPWTLPLHFTCVPPSLRPVQSFTLQHLQLTLPSDDFYNYTGPRLRPASPAIEYTLPHPFMLKL